VQAGVELGGSAVDLDRDNARPVVLLVGFDPGTQAPFGSYLLRDGRRTLGQDLAPGEVLLSASLADALEARVGDRLRAAIGPDRTADLKVAGVAEATGPGAYGLRPAVFAPLATLRLVTGRPDVNVIRIATAGEGRAEMDSAHQAAGSVRSALAALPGGGNLQVREAKRDEVESAREFAQSNVSIFTGLGLLVALAGVTLVVMLALALAEERRPRHAVLRALGLTRSGLVVLSVLEGGIYGVLAALLAPIPGALLGLGMVRIFARWPRFDPNGTRATQVLPAFEPGSLALAIAIGGLITIATLFVTSVRSSRMEISSAVKDLPEPVTRRKWSVWRTAALGPLGLAAIAAVVVGNSPIRLLGGAALILVAAGVARPLLPERVLATLAGAALAIWAVAGAAQPENALNTDSGPLFLVLAIPLSVFGLSLVLASNLRLLEAPAGLLPGKAKATMRPSLAHLARRPLRAGLGTGAFGLVLTVMAVIATFVPSLEQSITVRPDDYDIRVTASTHPGLTLPDSVRSQIVRDIAVPTRPYVGAVSQRLKGAATDSSRGTEYLPLYTLTREQLSAAPFGLLARDPRYRSDAEVWQALASDPSLVVTPIYSNPGAVVTLSGPDGPVRFRVAAGLATFGLWGLVGSEAAMAPFTTLPVGTTILARTAPGADRRAVAREVQRAVALTLREIIDEQFAVAQVPLDTLKLMLGLGLLVGVLSLGILALRAVVERRRSIGVLRALGFRPGNVLAGMLLEVLITATVGAVVGIGVGLLMGWFFIGVFAGSASFRVDGSFLALTVALMYAAVLAVTFGPALRAARLPAVEALRVED
jgi:putative ABC transport system permease protein